MKFVPEHDDDRVLKEVAVQNPTYLIGGYSIDAIILSIWHELYEHTEIGVRPSREEVHERITKALEVIYEGIV